MNYAFISQVGLVKFLYRTAIRQFYKRVLSKDQRIRLPTGLDMTLPIWNSSATEVYVTGCSMDWGSESLFARFMEADKDFVDVGAHVGYYSLYMAPLVRRVLALEPDPRLKDAITGNLSGHPQMKAMFAALSRESGQMKLSVSGNAAVSHLIGREDRQEESAVTVDVFTLDQVVENEGLCVTGIKIDVEGWDLDVILGAERTMKEQQPLILAEIVPTPPLLEAASRMGYALYAFVREDMFKPAKLEQVGVDSRKCIKMTFLVPHRLAGSFQELAAEN